MSIAVGFDEGTFESARAPWWERFPVFLIGGITAFVGAMVTYTVTTMRGRKSNTGRAIIAQYEPPRGHRLAARERDPRHAAQDDDR